VSALGQQNTLMTTSIKNVSLQHVTSTIWPHITSYCVAKLEVLYSHIVKHLLLISAYSLFSTGLCTVTV